MVFLRHVSIALSAAAAALGSALFLAFNFLYQRKLWTPQAEYSMLTEESQAGDRKQQILVLGLDGAGKSSLLHRLTLGAGPPGGVTGPQGGVARPGHCRPTRGFNFMSLRGSTYQLDFLEIGGDEELRSYWWEYLRKTDILVYVVDSSDHQRLPLARQELQLLLQTEQLLPVVVLANKQDQAGALGVSELYEELSLGSVTQDRHLHLLPTQLGTTAVGLEALQDLLLQLG